MARYGFYYDTNLLGNVGKTIKEYVITNSQTISIGDAVTCTVTTGVGISGANANIMGIVDGFTDNDGRPGGVSPYIEYTASTVPFEFVAEGDNQTDKMIKARVIVSPFAIYSNEPDATINSTTGSGKFGYYSDIVSASNQVDESDASSGEKQMFIYGTKAAPDLSGTTYGLYIIHQSQLWVTTN